MIQIIREELLKSAELTGIWEKKLREIEKRTYNAGQFLEELKQMVSEVVKSVLSDNSNRFVTIQTAAAEKTDRAVSKETSAGGKSAKEPGKRTSKKAVAKKKTETVPDAAPVRQDVSAGQPCPLCGKGTIIKGRTAYGCSEWRNGCPFRKPFE